MTRTRKQKRYIMPAPIVRVSSVEVYPTPYELALSFCSLDEDEQAEFFNCIAHQVKTNWKKPFCFQLAYITDSPKLNTEGRRIMEEIGEYS